MILPALSGTAFTAGGNFTAAGSLAPDPVGLTGALPHATSIPTIAQTHPLRKALTMALLLLEALGAGLIFVGIIWWTMFSGRINGELPEPGEDKDKNS